MTETEDAIETRAVVPEQLNVWRQIWRRPRATMRGAIAAPSFAFLLAPVCSGIVQSLLQAANTQVGGRGASVLLILGGASLVGSLWGLLQLHVIAGFVYLFTGGDGKNVPFSTFRSVLAVAQAPLAIALLLWLAATLSLGRDLYAEPALWASRFSPIAMLAVALLYLCTVACIGWCIVLQVVGIAEARNSSVVNALWTLLASIVVGSVVTVGTIVVAVSLLR